MSEDEQIGLDATAPMPTPAPVEEPAAETPPAPTPAPVENPVEARAPTPAPIIGGPDGDPATSPIPGTDKPEPEPKAHALAHLEEEAHEKIKEFDVAVKEDFSKFLHWLSTKL